LSLKLAVSQVPILKQHLQQYKLKGKNNVRQ
jgi:hypothetical protein